MVPREVESARRRRSCARGWTTLGSVAITIVAASGLGAGGWLIAVERAPAVDQRPIPSMPEVSAVAQPDLTEADEIESSAEETAEEPLVEILPLGLISPCEPVFYDINPDQSTLDASDPDGASSGRCNGLASVAGNNQVFYTATEWGGIYKSVDGGQTWFRLDGHMPNVAWDVEVDPSNTAVVYATSFYDGRVSPLSGIEVSYDAGLTWTHPLTSVPNSPADEGTAADNTPQAGYSCSSSRRTEPSAFGIAIRPDAAQNVFVGTNCGLAISNDSGATWTFVDPDDTPGSAANVWDVVAQAGGPTGQGIIDVCGDRGHFRSTDGGGTWTGGSGGLPGGRCSIAASPDESYVLFVAAADNFIYESDDAGATWTNLGSPDIRMQGRIPFVAANQRSDLPGPVDRFDLWFGDVSLFQGSCVSQAAIGGTSRCPATYIGFCRGFCDDGTTPCSTDGNCTGIGSGNCNRGNTPCSNNAACAGIGPQTCAIGARPDPYALPTGWDGPFTRCRDADGNGCAHDDAGDIVFDTQAANDACPMLFTNDGGVYLNTDVGADCQDPNWEQPNVSPHALWLFGMDGADQAGDAAEDLYFGCQDTGTFATTDAGAASPTWFNRDCCDSFDIVADPTRVLSTLCCGFSIRYSGPGMVGTTVIATNPPGSIPTFNFPDFLGQFGTDQYIAVTSQGAFITSDITANPVVWTQLGAASTPAGGFCGVQVAVSGGTPTFYAQTSCGDGFTSTQLWKFTGTAPGGTWQRVDNNDGLTGGFGVFAVDPNDPARLYASNYDPAGVQMVFSGDGGLNWERDTELDQFMTGGGAFLYRTQRGPTNFTAFNGYAQPVLLAFDPEDSNLLVAGGRNSGVFLSRNGGARWDLLTDPFDSANSGIPHLPRPRFAYFDHEPADSGLVRVFVGTQGRGVWRIDVPVDVPVITVPGDVWFGETCVGEMSTATLSVCNTGDGECSNLLISNIVSSDPQFSVTEPSSGYPVEISPDFCFPFQVTFSPTAAGAQSAILTIESNDPSTPSIEVLVFGTGTVPDIRVVGSTDFGDVCAETVAEAPVSICNVGPCDLHVTDVSIINCPDGDFTLVSNPFPATVSPDSCLDVIVRFTPSSAGPKSCDLQITSDDPDTPVVVQELTANTPLGSIDVSGDLAFAPTVIQSVDACRTLEPFPVSNTGSCDLTITDFAISTNPEEFSVVALPSFPIVLEPGHVVGEGDLRLAFAPEFLDRDRLGEVRVTYVTDPITGATVTVLRSLCGEAVRTGARVLVTVGGVPAPEVKMIRIQRINANRNRPLLDTVDVARNLPLQTITPAPPCVSFQFHREYATIDNPIQLLPGSYQLSVMVRVNGKFARSTVGFDVTSCDFNATIVVQF